ncbi:hypothetical protein O3P69_019729 [Scylla paramamosain]|uniref:C2H2-type domain-containing protein n=1 Tax=Scylla paramamosain TaxID=85552 RepID=A0AAW0SWX0_SCYPA
MEDGRQGSEEHFRRAAVVVAVAAAAAAAMGDCQPAVMDELGVEGPEYTCDWFTCGLCGLRTSTIEGYVSHMIVQERCVLHLCPSAAVRDLLLPRFSKRRRRRRRKKDVKETSRGGGGGGTEEEEEQKEEEAKMEVEAEEVEMGDVRRWKCRVCCLTFSRQAAILNHFKLQHRVGGTMGGSDADPREAQGKILRTHMAVVHSERRAFQCDFQGCSFSFKTKGSLKRHQRRHTGERPFACQRCGRCFRESGSLTRHLQSQGSCVSKLDTQIPLYGRTLPFNPPQADRKPSVPPDIKLGLKQELVGVEEAAPSTHLLLALPPAPPGHPG